MTDANKDKKSGLGRRDMLRALGLGAGAAVAAVPAAVLPAQAEESDSEKKKARYRVTKDVEAFYRTNRY